jgi:tRNA (adenine-N(1)-)-methyltransferase non-catalytic subunit
MRQAAIETVKCVKMSTAHSYVRPNTYLFLRLPSDLLKLLEIKPNT